MMKVVYGECGDQQNEDALQPQSDITGAAQSVARQRAQCRANYLIRFQRMDQFFVGAVDWCGRAPPLCDRAESS
jgi:hypothetical protein